MHLVVVYSSCRRAGHPWNVREAAGGCASQWGAATVQQEFSVVDDSGASRGGAEQGSSGGSGVVMGQMGCIVDGHPSGGWDCPTGGLLAAYRHVCGL